MIDPKVINVICPHCSKAWMNWAEESGEYFCCACGFTLTEEEAKSAAWISKSSYYGE